MWNLVPTLSRISLTSRSSIVASRYRAGIQECLTRSQSFSMRLSSGQYPCVRPSDLRLHVITMHQMTTNGKVDQNADYLKYHNQSPINYPHSSTPAPPPSNAHFAARTNTSASWHRSPARSVLTATTQPLVPASPQETRQHQAALFPPAGHGQRKCE